MKYKDLIQFDPIETVVQLREADDKGEAANLVRTYVISDRMADILIRLVIPQLQFAVPRDNKGLMIVGNYGTGKSHLMSVLSAVAEHGDLAASLTNEQVAEAAQAIAGQFRVVRTEIGSTTMPLRDILFGELEMALAQMGITYRFPGMDQAPNNKDLLVAMMSAFHERYPDQGLLLVVDELLDYLRSRRDQALVLDLTFLRELGEACRLTRFRFMAGIQESLFDSPRFQFVADSVRRVRDRFEQVRIAREDVAYVVAERLLRKNAQQRGWIREHLQRFTPLYGTMAERLDEFVRLFPVHPAYLDIFEQVYVAEKREVLKTLSVEMQDRLERDVPADETGLIAYDTYWLRLRENPSFRSIPEVKKVIDKSKVLEDRVRNAYTRPQYQPAALRIIHALSVHRLTTGDINAPLGATAEELRDGLCLYYPDVPEQDADFLKTTVDTTLREIMRTVSGQFLSYNPDNGQYYLDLEKDVDIDAKIEQKAETLEPGHLDRYYFESLLRVMECPEATYVPGYRIWQHEVEWRDHRVTRPGYLFFGSPNQRSTAQPPREFYLYMLQPFEPTPFNDEHRADEVFFRLARRDEEFETTLKLYAGAREMALMGSDHRVAYEKKANDYLRALQKWLRESLPQAMDVTYKGVTRPFIEWIKHSLSSSQGAATPQATKSVRDLVNAVASACLATHFDEQLPDYPTFSILITQTSRAQAAQEAVRWLAGRLKTRQGTAVLDALDLLDDSAAQGPLVKGRDSRYAGYFLQQLTEKGEGQVLNRSELIGGDSEAQRDQHFKLEPEWVAVTLLALVYTGEISLALPGRKLDAGNLEEAVTIDIADLADWKFIERPKGLPLAALTELFQLLELPTGLVKDANQHVSAVEQLQKRVAEELDRLVMARQKVQDGLPVWNTHVLEGQAQADLLRRLDAHKGFLESLQTYNTPGKLRNFRYSADEVKAQATGRALRADVEALAEVVSAVQPLAAYLGVAMAVLPSTGSGHGPAGHEWRDKVVALQEQQLTRLRDPKQWRQPHLRSSLTATLENLKSEYIRLYLDLHRRARLNAAEDERKKKLVSDPRQKQLTALAGIEFLPVADLEKFQKKLSKLEPCYAVGASDLKEQPICPHCGYRPVEEPQAAPVQARLEHLENRLESLHAAWTQALLDNLSTSATQENLALMSAGQRALIQAFLEAGELPVEVSYEFVDTVREALTGLERVAVLPEDILMALTQGGMPCTVQELQSRFRGFVDEQIKGKDPNKVRIVIEW